MPYTYLIGWSELNLWYYGVRFARGCDPTDLWVKYFTSSNLVKKMRNEVGEPDVIEVRRTFDTAEEARCWEYRVLCRTCAKKSPKWLNQSDSRAIFIMDPVRRKEIARSGAVAMMAKLEAMPDDVRAERMEREKRRRAEGVAKRTPEQLAASTLIRKAGYAAKSHEVKLAFLEKCKQSHVKMWAGKDSSTRAAHGKAVADGLRRNRSAMSDEQLEEDSKTRSKRISESKARAKSVMTAEELASRKAEASERTRLSWAKRRIVCPS